VLYVHEGTISWRKVKGANGIGSGRRQNITKLFLCSCFVFRRRPLRDAYNYTRPELHQHFRVLYRVLYRVLCALCALYLGWEPSFMPPIHLSAHARSVCSRSSRGPIATYRSRSRLLCFIFSLIESIGPNSCIYATHCSQSKRGFLYDYLYSFAMIFLYPGIDQANAMPTEMIMSSPEISVALCKSHC